MFNVMGNPHLLLKEDRNLYNLLIHASIGHQVVPSTERII